MRGVIELKRGANANVVLNLLYKNTQLQDSFGINLVALVNGQPKQLNIKEILVEFLSFRREVVTRVTMFRRDKLAPACTWLKVRQSRWRTLMTSSTSSVLLPTPRLPRKDCWSANGRLMKPRDDQARQP